MDPNGNIYESENVNPEDKARLDGYLKGRAEADALRAKLADAKEVGAEPQRFTLTAHEQTGTRAYVTPPLEPGQVIQVEALRSAHVHIQIEDAGCPCVGTPEEGDCPHA